MKPGWKLAFVVVLLGLPGLAAAQTDEERSHATEVWAPVPPKVEVSPAGVPSDAIVLFDGVNVDSWAGNTNDAAGWDIDRGDMVVHAGAGDIHTKQDFCDVQLHIEWQVPSPIGADGKVLQSQERNNSGIFLQSRYEVQVLDSWGDARTYVNGEAGAIYKQSIPLVNATRPPETWQSYDIIYHAPKFDAAGAVTTKARITVLLNGVLVQDNFEIQGPTVWIGRPPYVAHGCAPLSLQDHGHPVRYRNIWIRPLR